MQILLKVAGEHSLLLQLNSPDERQSEAMHDRNTMRECLALSYVRMNSPTEVFQAQE